MLNILIKGCLLLELNVVERNGEEKVVLLNDDMEIVKPIYDYLKHLKLKDRAKNTIRAYGRDLKLYWEFLEQKGYDYRNVTPRDIGGFIEFLREPDYEHDEKVSHLNVESKRSNKTINRILSTVYNFYKYCSMVLEVDNPILKEEVERPSDMFKSLLHHIKSDNKTKRSIFKVKESEYRVKILDNQEVKKFLDNLNTWRDKLIFKVMYLSGARIQEVLDLKIEDIPRVTPSLEEEGVAVLEEIESKGKRRDLYMPVSLVNEIDDFIMEERLGIETEHNYLFVAQQSRYLGKPLTYRAIYGVFKRVQKKTGIKFNFHDLRHTCITRLMEKGMDASVAKRIAGHKYLSTTQQYTHLSNNYVKNAMDEYWQETDLLEGDSDV